MQKISLTIRVDKEEIEKWRKRSNGNLSAWIRERCNGEEEAGNAKKDAKAGRTVHASNIERGSVPVAEPSVRGVLCSHGATAYNCKKWGCKFYEVVNGRG